jgi:hypothetical protein
VKAVTKIRIKYTLDEMKTPYGFVVRKCLESFPGSQK